MMNSLHADWSRAMASESKANGNDVMMAQLFFFSRAIFQETSPGLTLKPAMLLLKNTEIDNSFPWSILFQTHHRNDVKMLKNYHSPAGRACP